MTARAVITFSTAFGLSCSYFRVVNADSFKSSTPPGHTFILNPPIPLQKDPPEVKTGKEICKYGYPSTTNLSFFPTYVASVNYCTRVPNWVAEKLTRESLIEGSTDRGIHNFTVDPDTPKMFRATNKDYKDSGFDRGHLAPAADHKSSSVSMGSTFQLSTNVVPQDRNINSGLWLQLEHVVRRLTKWFDEVYVVTGPLFLPELNEELGKRFVKYEVIGEKDIAVPTHLFKVVLAVKEKQTFNAAWIIPNNTLRGVHRLVNYQQSLETVEHWSGLRFFPALRRDLSENICKDYKKCTLLSKRLWKLIGKMELAESMSELDEFRERLPHLLKGKGSHEKELVDCVVTEAEQRLLNS